MYTLDPNTEVLTPSTSERALCGDSEVTKTALTRYVIGARRKDAL